MNKHFLTLLAALLLGALSAWAGTPPQASTNGDEHWYLVQFLNGGNALTAETDGAEITTAAAVGSAAQLWKFTGNASDGYVMTNKKGLTLYTSGGQKNNMVLASSAAGGVNRYKIVTTTNASFAGGYEIQPYNNAGVSMNIWGGPEENRGVGLWDKGDKNNPVEFVSEESLAATAGFSIVPYPQSLEVTQEGTLNFAAITTLAYPDQASKPHAEAFARQWEAVSGVALELVEGVADAQVLQLSYNSALPEEGYTLHVADGRIDIKASQQAGFFYAFQTLKQLLPRQFFAAEKQQGVEWTLPYVAITDQPLLSHRGFMMDIARHYFNKEEVKRVLDIMALYKMNRFHWHLTDDQGWRIHMDKYPRLTEVGAVRSGSFTSPGDGTKFFDDTEYGRGCFYTKDDLIEVVAYAKERHIEILPEVDLPGHMVAAVASYPEFSCDPSKSYSVRLDGGISEDVLNVGDDKVITFLKDVLDYLAEVFPYPYVHIGGDECPTKQWATNADCLRRVQEEGLSGVEELQSWLVEELGTYVKEVHGKDIVVWDELLSHWDSNNTVKPVIMAWNSLDKSADAAKKGFKSIVSPYSHLYLDFMQVGPNETLIDEPYYGGWSETNTNTLQEAYTLNPLASLSGKEEYCMGVQGNLWAETLNDFGELQYQLLPRMLALAETGWLPVKSKNWNSFYLRLQQQDEILDALGYIYAKHHILPTEQTEAEQLLAEAEALLEASRGGQAGFPSKNVHDQLVAIYDVAKMMPTDEAVLAALSEKVDAYKAAEIVQPEAGKYYQIVSASTYYKKQFAGSTMYQDGNQVRIHYTPQVEPEELWRFVESGKAGVAAYKLENVCSGEHLAMVSYNQAVSMGDAATDVRVDKATIATANYDYLPGVVNISAVDGYSAAEKGSVKRLSAQTSGLVFAKDEAALCYPGTWMLVEVEDFKVQLEGLVKKCQAIVRDAKPGEIDQPSEDALQYLQQELIDRAKLTLEALNVVEQKVYEEYLECYRIFLTMPRTSLLDAISEAHYYTIENAYFTGNYAYANASSGKVEPKALNSSDAGFLWRFVKNNGTVKLMNKATGKAAYIASSKEGATLMANYSGSGLTDWTLEELKTDLGGSGIAIVDPSGTYSWYVNPGAFPTVITKPKDWGASIWLLNKTETLTGVEATLVEKKAPVYYDLGGRRVLVPQQGIYITGEGEKRLFGK
ncbi:MAG: family 20 glycosylhydrolase [Bacteroidaceae bacterium]|nr:family 20 glycosylhydrolase [Bacteroidaceae bacterium]